MAQNYEAVVLEPKAQITVRPSEKYEPRSNELLIRSTIVSVSPFEAKMQQRAIYPIPYPASFGSAFAGVVETVGADVTSFSKGDSVAIYGGSRTGDLRRGAHQRYVICEPSKAAKVGEGADPEQLATIMSNITTVIPILSIKAGLDRPSASPNPSNRNQKVLIYGGTTQLGRLCVQYAKSAGYAVVTTTSPRGEAETKSLKPDVIVDHSQAQEVATHELIANGPYVAVIDTVSKPPTQEMLAPVLRENARQGQTNLVWAVAPASADHEGVEFSMNSYPGFLDTDPKGPELKKWLFDEYVPGLYNGTYANEPAGVEKVSGGLKSLQSMYDRVQSMSGKKLVYSPWDE